MRRRLVVFALVLTAVLVGVPTANAGDYQSGFGIGLSVPDAYLVLTREAVQENAALFLEESGETRFHRIPGVTRRAVYDRVRSGEVEIFYRTEGVGFDFVDNVNVMRQSARLPQDEGQLSEVCRLLPIEFSRVFGRPVSLDGCELRAVAGRRALYLAFDGAVPGTRTLQYQIERSQGETLVITATAAIDNISRMMGEFEQIVASIRMR